MFLWWVLACQASIDDSEPSATQTESETSDSEEPASEARWAEAVTADAITTHLDALQAIADANDDTRVAGSEGYAASVAYVTGALEDAGYVVEVQDFSFSDWALEDATLEVDGEALSLLSEFYVLSNSAAGEATGPLAAVDLMLPPGSAANSATSGCEEADFADFPAGAIALLQRGTCTFTTKVENAEAAGAIAVLVFNEGQSGRTDVFAGQLDADATTIPALTLSYDTGAALAEALDAGEVTVSVSVDAVLETIETQNLFATWPGSSGEQVVVGAHLDSVTAGPGINDNGSGTALVLTLAETWAALAPEAVQDLRFAWWGAEEWGLLGSFAYVDSLSEDELDATLANLNFDMVASPNPVRFVYDGDGDETGSAGPTGSDTIEALFTDYFDAEELDWAATAFDGRSDYGPFIWSGVPAGGLFSGAEGVMTQDEAKATGGEAGASYDPCYHQACDSRDNIDEAVLEQMAGASVHATWSLVMEEHPLAIGRRQRADRRDHPVAAHGHCGHPEEPAY